MCYAVYINGTRNETIAELKKALNRADLPMLEGYRQYTPEEETKFCCCAVDFNKLILELGCKVEDDCMDYNFLLNDKSFIGKVRVDRFTKSDF